MATQKAEAFWESGFGHGAGSVHVSSEAFEGEFPTGPRFTENPDVDQGKMVSGALAKDYTVMLAQTLEEEGFSPHRILTFATVQTESDEPKARILRIDLACEADVPLIEHRDFQRAAHKALTVSTVAQYLQGAPINLDSMLVTEVCPESRRRGDSGRVRIR